MPIDKVNESPLLPTPLGLTSIESINDFLTSLVSSLANEERTQAVSVNKIIDSVTGSVALPTYPKANLPSPVLGGLIFVTDDVGGSTPAFSDGVSWRRTADRNVIT
jgi:hypothetical protein